MRDLVNDCLLGVDFKKNIFVIFWCTIFEKKKNTVHYLTYTKLRQCWNLFAKFHCRWKYQRTFSELSFVEEKKNLDVFYTYVKQWFKNFNFRILRWQMVLNLLLKWRTSRIFSQFQVYPNITQKAKQIINLLLLNNFYHTEWYHTDEFKKKATDYTVWSLVMVRRVQKESDELYGLVTRYGPRTSCQRSQKKRIYLASYELLFYTVSSH